MTLSMLNSGPRSHAAVYAGVGSRETPADVFELMHRAASIFARAGWTVRTGGALGADEAFASGAAEINAELCELYLPWRGYNGKSSRFSTPSPDAVQIASGVHPTWESLGVGAKMLHARNVHIGLGPDVLQPLLPRFILCWTKDGARRESESSSRTGGTRTVIVLGSRLGVPVHNLQRKESISWVERALDEIMESIAA